MSISIDAVVTAGTEFVTEINIEAQIALWQATSPSIFADEDAGERDGAEKRLKWTNDGTDKIKWYFFEPSYAVSINDIRSFFMVANKIGARLPFIMVYTKPQGSGDLGGWFRSRITYERPANSGETGYAEYFAKAASGVEYGLKALGLTENYGGQDLKTAGYLDEEILYIGIGSDGAESTAGAYNFSLEEFGFAANDGHKTIARFTSYVAQSVVSGGDIKTVYFRSETLGFAHGVPTGAVFYADNQNGTLPDAGLAADPNALYINKNGLAPTFMYRDGAYVPVSNDERAFVAAPTSLVNDYNWPCYVNASGVVSPLVNNQPITLDAATRIVIPASFDPINANVKASFLKRGHNVPVRLITTGTFNTDEVLWWDNVAGQMRTEANVTNKSNAVRLGKIGVSGVSGSRVVLRDFDPWYPDFVADPIDVPAITQGVGSSAGWMDIEQRREVWGVTSHAKNITHTFVVPFADVPRLIFCCGAIGSSERLYRITSLTNQGFKATCRFATGTHVATSGRISFHAIGKKP